MHQLDDLVEPHRPRGHHGVREVADALGPGRGTPPASSADRATSGVPGRIATVVALQRTAGNQAVSRAIQDGRTPATVQRCGPGGCGPAGCDSTSEENAAPAAQAVLGQEDEFSSPGQAVDRPGAAVQRAATFAAGPVHQVNNLADCVVNGTPAGVTWPTLNGAQFWSSPAVRGAITRPTLKTTAVPVAPGGAGGGFDAEVDVVPNNTAGFDETVLAAGPWRINTTRATIAAMLPAPAVCNGPGATRFRAFGNPSDAHMATANRRHEDHHANDHKAAFNATVVPWDQKLTAAKASGQKFHGATAADAEAALWAAMGGTPEQVADAFFNACAAAVVAYHGTAAGGPIGAPTSPGANATCSISWAKYRNPS